VINKPRPHLHNAWNPRKYPLILLAALAIVTVAFILFKRQEPKKVGFWWWIKVLWKSGFLGRDWILVQVH
jgi:hypothetical protein